MVRNAATKSDFCNLTISWDRQTNSTIKLYQYQVFIYKIQWFNFRTIFMFQHTETEYEKLYDICMKSDHPNVMICPFEGHIESKEAKSNTEKLKYKLRFYSIKYITVITNIQEYGPELSDSTRQREFV